MEDTLDIGFASVAQSLAWLDASRPAMEELVGELVRLDSHTGDAAGVARHLPLMEQPFRATQNPWLIQQHALLRAKVAQLGLIPQPRSQDPGPLASRSGAPLDPVTQTALDLEAQGFEPDFDAPAKQLSVQVENGGYRKAR